MKHGTPSQANHGPEQSGQDVRSSPAALQQRRDNRLRHVRRRLLQMA